MPKPFDASSKQLLDLGPADWLAVAGLPVPSGTAAVTVVDADLSTVSAAADKLIRVDAGPASYLAHVEFQASPDPSLDDRVLMYNALGRWRHGLPVRSVALLLRAEAAPASVTGRVIDRVDADVGLEFRYRLVRVWELAVQPLLRGPLATLPLAPIAAVSAAELPDVVSRLQQRLTTEPAAARPADVWAATQWLIGMRYPAAFLETLMLDLMNPPEGSALYDLLQKGRAEGEAKGEAKGRLLMVLQIGTDRFGPPPKGVRRRLMAVTDPVQIGRLGSRVLTAAGWSDLFATLDAVPPPPTLAG